MKLYGLIGYPLTHSFSEKYFKAKFQKENISDVDFKTFAIKDLKDFSSIIKSNDNLKGLSVTIPHKENIIPFLDELDETAKNIGAVNCVKIVRSSENVDSSTIQNLKPETSNVKLIGFNTDAYGFQQSIKPFLETQHEKALIIGTGGAAKAVAYVLKNIGIDVHFVSRKTNHSTNNSFSYSELNQNIVSKIKLIVNATPLGMYPNTNESPEIPYEYITSEHLCYDLIYNPEESLFLQKAKNNGAVTINGLSMLHHQADKAWEIWNK